MPREPHPGRLEDGAFSTRHPEGPGLRGAHFAKPRLGTSMLRNPLKTNKYPFMSYGGKPRPGEGLEEAQGTRTRQRWEQRGCLLSPHSVFLTEPKSQRPRSVCCHRAWKLTGWPQTSHRIGHELRRGRGGGQWEDLGASGPSRADSCVRSVQNEAPAHLFRATVGV